VQWLVTIALSGVSADVAASTQVVSLTSPSAQSVTFSQFTSNSYSQYFDAGSTVSGTFANPLASTTAGKRYALTSGSPFSFSSLSAPQTATGTYKVQYQVTFAQSGIGVDTGTNQVLSLIVNGGSPTAYSASTLPPATWYDDGTVLTYAYSATVATSPASGKRYALTTPVPSPASPITVSAPATVTGTYKVQWQITFAQSGLSSDATGTVVTVGASAKAYGDTPFSDWFDEGSSLTYAYSSPVASTTTGKQYALTTPAPSPASGFNVGSSITITGTYKVQWQITFAATGLGGDVTPGATIVTVNGGPQTSVPYPVFLDAGSTPSYVYSSPISTTVTGKRYILTTPAPSPATGFTVTTTITITAAYKAQYDTQTVVTSSVNPSILAQSVQFTATVTTIAPGGGTPTGSVQFKVDGSAFGSPVALSGGIANSATTTTLAVGTHTVEADYTPDTDTYTGSIGMLAGGQKVQYASGGVCDGDLGHSILQPINADGTSVFKQTSTVPAKFRVCDYNGNSIGTAGVVSGFRLVQVVSGTSVNTVDEAVDSTTPDTMFRWDPTGQQWIFNISTKYAPVNVKNQTYSFTISLNDGSTIMFIFGLK
jgi:large repetitive protein